MKLKIIKRKDGSFQGSDGEQVNYFWYDGIRLSDDTLIQFGSREGGHAEGETMDLEVVRYEKKDGSIGYKEVAEY